MPTDGRSTSEFTLAKLVIIVGAILQAAAVGLEAAQVNGLGGPWVAIALATCGTILQALSAFGYTKSRTLVKTEQARTQAVTQALGEPTAGGVVVGPR